MRLEIEIPDDWANEKKGWHIDSYKLLSCSQCSYKTPVPALYVTHVYSEHGTYKEEDASLTTAP